MNLLTDRLPEEVEINGKWRPIRTGFSIGVQFELLMQDAARNDEELLFRALELYYPSIPDDLSVALDRLLWFYRCGRDPEGEKPYERNRSSAQRVRRVYSFEQDADLIFAAFWETYGIDLSREDLHWWKFRALFSALPPDCEFSRVVGYRTADTRGMPKKQKQVYEKLKQRYAIKSRSETGPALTLAQRDQKMKDYIDRRFQECAGER